MKIWLWLVSLFSKQEEKNTQEERICAHTGEW